MMFTNPLLLFIKLQMKEGVNNNLIYILYFILGGLGVGVWSCRYLYVHNMINKNK